jgi:hypothetical protein
MNRDHLVYLVLYGNRRGYIPPVKLSKRPYKTGVYEVFAGLVPVESTAESTPAERTVSRWPES